MHGQWHHEAVRMHLPLRPASHCIRCTTIRAASWRSEMELKLVRCFPLMVTTNNNSVENRFKLNTYLGLRPIVKRAQWGWHLTIVNCTCPMTRSVRRPFHTNLLCVVWCRSDVNLNRILSLYNTGESSVYTLKMKRPSKGTVHFDCEDIDVIDQQQQKQQQLKVDNESNNFDSKSIDWSMTNNLRLDQTIKTKMKATYCILQKRKHWLPLPNERQPLILNHEQKKRSETEVNHQRFLNPDPYLLSFFSICFLNFFPLHISELVCQ